MASDQYSEPQLSAYQHGALRLHDKPEMRGVPVQPLVDVIKRYVDEHGVTDLESLRDAVAADPDPIQTIDGIGPEYARQLREWADAPEE